MIKSNEELNYLFIDGKNKPDIKLLKYKTKFFFCDCYGNDKDIDVQINDFVDKENVQIVDIKYALDNGCQYALLIYRKYEQVVVCNEDKL